MYQALNATSKTLRDHLRTQILADAFLNAPTSPWNMRSMQVTLNTPTEMVENHQEGLSLWLYRVVRDPEHLTDPAVRMAVSTVMAPPLALRVLLDLVSERRAWPDQAHLAAQDVPELRQLVQGNTP